MRIVIDMQGAQTESRFRGIGRYALSFAQGIARNRGEHEVYLALNGLFPDTLEPIRAEFHDILPQENIRVWYSPGPTREVQSGNFNRRSIAQLVREAFLESLRPDIIHLTSLFEGYLDDAVISIGAFNSNIPVSVTLYDLIPLLNPNQYLEPNPDYRSFYERKISELSKCSLMLAISEHSRREGMDSLGAPPERVVNVSTAVGDQFQPRFVSEENFSVLKSKLNINRPFILCTGGADGRKNLGRLLLAYSRLEPNLRDRHQLVLAGKIREEQLLETKAAAISAGINENEIIFADYVTDDDLILLYNQCAVFVFPSWHEGFGLPALEAMACGAAAIGANRTSVPEVIGNPDALFDPFEIDDIAAKLSRVLSDEVFREDLRSKGLIRAKDFSWDETAGRSIAAFELLLDARQSSQIAIKSIVEKLIEQIVDLSVPIEDSEMRQISYAVDRCFPERSHNQLLVDISELVQRDARTGVQRVTRSILHQLLSMRLDGYVVEPVYATIDRPGYRYATRYMRRQDTEVNDQTDENISIWPGDVFLGLDLQHHTTRVQERFLLNARQDGVRIFFVVYDLLPIQFPNYWPTQHSVDKVHSDWLYVVCKFDGALCISRAVADQLRVWMEKNGPPRHRPFEIKWFHLGADVDNTLPTRGLPNNAEVVLNLIRSKPTFLCVGTLEPRKGYSQALAAFENLWRGGQDLNLVIVGKQGWLVETLVEKILKHEELGNRLFWLHAVSDEYLERIYQASTCLLATSEGEGFGLPLIEAAQQNLPIIARNLPVFKEVAGNHAYYFEGLEPEKLALAVRNWLNLYLREKSPKVECLDWLTWRQSTEQLIAILNIKSSMHEIQ